MDFCLNCGSDDKNIFEYLLSLYSQTFELTFNMIVVQILLVNCWQCGSWWSTIDSQVFTVHSWLSNIDGQVLMNLDHQKLAVQIFMVRMLMVCCCWIILGSSVHCWLPTLNNQVLTSGQIKFVFHTSPFQIMIEGWNLGYEFDDGSRGAFW